MKHLIIDTSTSEYSIGVSDKEKILAQKSWKNERGKDNNLLGEIEKLLSPAGLDGIIVYLGPGSYTGLRIGITIANTFAYSLNIPIVGIRGDNLGNDKFEIAEMEPQNLEELLRKGKPLLSKAKIGEYQTPFYGREANVG